MTESWRHPDNSGDRSPPLDADDRRRREAAAAAAAHHRIYLGMASGVGKTYAALHELYSRRARGADTVIAFVETYDRPKTVQAIGDLEIVPRRTIVYEGVPLEEMDLRRVLLRHPDVALVDELAHTNAPGSPNEKRWQDVDALLADGISVISTLNIQHVESLADIVEAITGVAVQERIPDSVVDKADEIELVDLSPRALRQRIQEGEVYPRERAEQALRHYFREGNLSALRELALRTVATEVERQLEAYMREHDVHAIWPAGERVMVGVNEQPYAQALIRRAWRRAHWAHARLLVVFVVTPNWVHASAEAKQQLEANLRVAETLGCETVRVEDVDVGEGLVRAAHVHNVSELFIGRSRHGPWHRLMGGSIVQRVIGLCGDMDVHIVAVHNER